MREFWHRCQFSIVKQEVCVRDFNLMRKTGSTDRSEQLGVGGGYRNIQQEDFKVRRSSALGDLLTAGTFLFPTIWMKTQRGNVFVLPRR